MNIGQPERLLPRLKTYNKMNITAVKIYPFNTCNAQTSFRAYVDMSLDDFVVIKGFRLLVGKYDDLFGGIVSKKGKDVKYHDQVDFKKNVSILRDRILESYKEFF